MNSRHDSGLWTSTGHSKTDKAASVFELLIASRRDRHEDSFAGESNHCDSSHGDSLPAPGKEEAHRLLLGTSLKGSEEIA